MFLNADMANKHLDRNAPNGALDMRQDQAKPEYGGFNEMLSAVGKHKDKDAFIQLFEHFAPRIKSFLMKSGASPETADELAQETMLTIWNKAESYNPAQAAASTWIFTIARNKRIDALRRTKRHDPDPADPLLVEDAQPGPGQNALHREETRILSEAIKTLPDEQALLVRKSFFEDKSHAVIAEETGIALGTVKSRIRLALERLRKDNKIQSIWT